MGVRRESKQQVIEALRRRYRGAGRAQKRRWSDEAAAVTGYQRRYAQALLRQGVPYRGPRQQRGGRPRVYGRVRSLTPGYCPLKSEGRRGRCAPHEVGGLHTPGSPSPAVRERGLGVRAPALSGRLARVQHLLDGAGQLCLGYGTDHTADLPAILEEDQRRDAHDAVVASHVGAIVHVHLDGAQAALILAGQLLNHRTDQAARAAPGRPEVH